MSSQEEYLDNLLSNLDLEALDDNAEEAAGAVSDDSMEEAIRALSDDNAEEAAGVVSDDSMEEAIRALSDDNAEEAAGVVSDDSMEEAIRALLDDSVEEAVEAVSDDNTELEDADDLMSLLENSQDEELLEIQGLLQSVDNNEEIDASLPIQEEGDALSEEKKQERTARKEAKRAEREAKKAERLAKKEARKAEKRAKKDKKSKQEAVAVEEDPKQGTEQQSELAEPQEAVDAQEVAVPVEAVQTEDTEQSITDALTDDIFAGIASLDLFGEPDLDAGGLGDVPDVDIGAAVSESSASEASLAQFMDDEKKAKKKGLFARFIDFINEEDEEENENIPISEENREILNEMDKEGKKKKKEKKPKKGKKKEAADGEAEAAEEEGKGEKKKKEKKPKKEKAPKVVVEETGGKKLPLKKVALIFVVCLSLAAIICIMTTVVGEYSLKKAGREAYYAENYQACYQNFYGKDLNESEQVMFSKSESILIMRMWIREYELLVEEGLELEALDSLLQSMYDYPALYEYALQWNAGAEVTELYQYILTILSEKYQLTEEQAKEIINTVNDVEYTKKVRAVIAGEGYDSPNQTDGAIKADEALTDVLPEEPMAGDTVFVDNN